MKVCLHSPTFFYLFKRHSFVNFQTYKPVGKQDKHLWIDLMTSTRKTSELPEFILTGIENNFHQKKEERGIKRILINIKF